MLVRYVVDHYNQRINARMGNQSRIGRWEAGGALQWLATEPVAQSWHLIDMVFFNV